MAWSVVTTNLRLVTVREGAIGWRRGPQYRRSRVTLAEGRDLSSRLTLKVIRFNNKAWLVCISGAPDSPSPDAVTTCFGYERYRAGSLNQLTVNAPIETFGKGARGFNVYDGTLNQATFDRITTHADGAV